MNIMIAGATGFVGQALTKHLLAKGYTVSVLTRKIRPDQPSWGNQVQWYTWDTLEAHTLASLNVIINLCGENIAQKRWSQSRQQEIMASRITTTQQLAQYCSQLGSKSPKLLNASAIGVYDAYSSIDQSPCYDEDSPIDFTHYPHFLARVARQWEMATWCARDRGVTVINCRFGVILDPSGGALKQLLPSFRWGLGARLGHGRQAFCFISLDDAVRALDFLITTTTLQGPINIVSPTTVTQCEFADSLAKILHRPRLLRIPSWMITALLGQMGTELLLSGAVVKPKRLQENGFVFLHSDLKRFIH